MEPFTIDLGSGGIRNVAVHPACAMQIAEQFLRRPDTDAIAIGILIGRRTGATVSVTDAYPLSVGADQSGAAGGSDAVAGRGLSIYTTTEQQAAIAKAACLAVPGEEPVGWFLVQSDRAAGSSVTPPDEWAIIMHEACTKYHGSRSPIALYTRAKETSEGGGGIDPRLDMCAYAVQRSAFLRDIAQPFRRLPVHVVAEEAERAAARLSLRHMAFQGTTDDLMSLAQSLMGGYASTARHAGLMSTEPELRRPAGLPVPRHRNAVDVMQRATGEIRRARANDPDADATVTYQAAALAGAREGPAAAVRLETRAHLRRLADLVEGTARIVDGISSTDKSKDEENEPLARLALEAAQAFPRMDAAARGRTWEAASADAAAAAQVGGLARSLAAAFSGSQAGSIGV